MIKPLNYCALLMVIILVLLRGAIAAPESPNIKRSNAKKVQIDKENIEVGVHAGLISIEDFGSDSVLAIRLAYHVTEDVFIEGHYGTATAQRNSFEEDISINFLSNDNLDFTTYDLSIGWNLLPGESYILDRWSLTSSFYLIAGTGQSEFSDNTQTTFNFGSGYRVLLNDWLALHLDFRDYIFDSDVLGREKTTHNLVFTTGIATFF